MHQQQAVNKHISATNLAQKQAFGRIVEKVRVAPGRQAVAPKHEAQQEMLEAHKAAPSQAYDKPCRQPEFQPREQPLSRAEHSTMAEGASYPDNQPGRQAKRQRVARRAIDTLVGARAGLDL